MAEVAVVELIVPQGATFFWEVNYVEDPDATPLVPIDLTGHDARMHVRAKVASQTTIYETDSDVGGHLSINGPIGRVSLEVPAAVTAAWTFKKAVFDLEVYDGAGVVTRIAKGTMELDLEVTR